MYRLETVYIEENFTAPDWGKKWLRGPLAVYDAVVSVVDSLTNSGTSKTKR